ncbi:MAG: molybdopterin-dependent oxidoreductase [Clostridiales Family XIII bacterium]|nr:molybdopterin-dependent oxidoreductase [Clostridiales Family XIII bacterium]
MATKPIDIKTDRRVIKAAGLQGPISGPPTWVDSDKDGKVIRVRPFHYDEIIDWEKKRPWKLEARGSVFEPPKRTVHGAFYLGYKKRVYSPNRVKYPLKRVDWDPAGERNPQNRGKSGYVRISWDEATQLIADELLRVKEKYGMSAVLSEADMHGEGKHVAPSHGCANRLLSLLGGYTIQMRNMDSWEGWAWGSKNVWGGEPVGEMEPAGNLWPDIAEHCDALLFWAGDPEVTPMGFDGYMASRLSQWLHNIGIKFIYVDPALNYSGCYLADKWIPVLPNTDAALYLAVAYVWLMEGTYEKEYVETHAVGAEEFFRYVRGEVDGEAKTPKWAAEKCGVPEYTIKALARYWGKKVISVTIGNGGPGIRGPFSSEPARLQSILLGMRGLGGPGVHQVKWLEWGIFSKNLPLPYQGETDPKIPNRAHAVPPPGTSEAFAMEDMEGRIKDIEARMLALGEGIDREKLVADLDMLRELTKPSEIPPAQSIPKCMVHDAILDGHVEWYGLRTFCGPDFEQWEKHEFPAQGCSELHMVWTDSPCMVTCWNDGFRFVKALRSEKIECVVAQHPWLENDCYLADIILPVATKFEMEDICEDFNGGIFESVFREGQACPPVGESKHDFDCVAEVARKLGDDYYKAYTNDELPLERLIELFWLCSNVSHLDREDEFHSKGIFVIPPVEGIEKLPAGLREFYEDPGKSPLSTPTGKLEFTSTKIKEHFPDDEERPPYPKWIEKSDLHDERLGGERAKTYPLLCMSNHGRWRFHAQLDDHTWNREVSLMKMRAADGYQYESAWINPRTAAAKGIAHGDVIKVFNERGIVLCAAFLTERLMEDVVYVDHGSRFDPIDPESVDRGGAINLITPTAIISKTATGMVVSGFLVDVAKVQDAEMAEWKKKFPEAFARKVDEDAGVCLEGWLQG